MDILSCARFIARSYPSAFFGRDKKVLKLGDLANVRAPVVESRFLVACLDSHCSGVKAPVAVGSANPPRISTNPVVVEKSNVTDFAAIAESMELHLALGQVAGMSPCSTQKSAEAWLTTAAASRTLNSLEIILGYAL
jgi:hypothetical protein